MQLSENAEKVLRKRYLIRDDAGTITETPDDMFRRVAAAVAGAETNYHENARQWEEKFFHLISSLKFLPNSPALMNAGKDIGQLAACFVLPVNDSMESIFNSLKNAALILQSGGGTGFSFSRLRPKADLVRSTGGVASGPVSFMRVYNTATEVIKQGGARRGANMGILRIDHPDILDFIRIKRTHSELENFNISVAVTDRFMKALQGKKSYDLINPRTRKKYASIKAQAVFNEIVESAWETGDPGIVFIDVINRFNPTPHVGVIESTNPCGEQPLLPYEACVLGSINVSRYMLRGRKTKTIDFGSLSDDVSTAVRFLDDAIDVNKYPLAEIEAMHMANRKIGLGVMGFADLLILLDIPYDSKKAFELARHLMKFISNSARKYSEGLAAKRGAFPNFHGSVYSKALRPEIRNATTTTIAPTGTLSIIADCSSGIEPLFALAYKRHVMETELIEVNKYFFETAKHAGFYTDELRDLVVRTGTLKDAEIVPSRIRNLYKTAHEISYRNHIEMQASFQKHTDNAVSKTINMPFEAKKKDVAAAILLAYKKGCKGVTVFRYGTRKKGPLLRVPDTD